MTKDDKIKHKIEHLSSISTTKQIRKLFDEMFEAWVTDCNMDGNVISEKHLTLRLISETIELLTEKCNTKDI